MHIDIHAHFIPPSLVASAESGRTWHGLAVTRRSDGKIDVTEDGRPFALPKWAGTDDAGKRLARMDATSVDIQMLSATWRLYRYEIGADLAAAMARQINDDIGQLVEEHPGRFLGLAQLPLQDPDLAIRELDRAMGIPGFVGAAVGTDVNGHEWDHEPLLPVLEAAQALGAIVFIHPSDRPVDSRFGRFHLRNLIGNPLETTLTIASLIFGGVIDRVPDVRVAFSHAGGFVPYGVGRFDHGFKVRPEAQEFATALPSEYLKRFYYDSIVHSDLGMRHLINTVGLSQCVMGSDDPADMGPADPVAFLRGCESLTEPEQEAVLGGNLESLLAATGRPVH